MPKLNKLQKMGELKNLYAYIPAIQSIRVTYFCHHTSPKRTTTYLNWMQMEQIEAKMCTVCGLLGKIRTHSTLFQKEGGGLCYMLVCRYTDNNTGSFTFWNLGLIFFPSWTLNIKPCTRLSIVLFENIISDIIMISLTPPASSLWRSG